MELREIANLVSRKGFPGSIPGPGVIVPNRVLVKYKSPHHLIMS